MPSADTCNSANSANSQVRQFGTLLKLACCRVHISHKFVYLHVQDIRILNLSLDLNVVILPTGAFVCPRDTMHPPLLNHSPRVLTHRLGFQSLGIRLGFHASSAPLEGILLSTFRVLNFRDWFGAQIIECTFKHMLRSRFRVLRFRDWFRQTKEYYIPGQTKEPGRNIKMP